MNTRNIVIVLLTLAIFLLSACNFGGGTDVIADANNACNDITSCVGSAPQELANLCQVAGGYHDASGTCVMP